MSLALDLQSETAQTAIPLRRLTARLLLGLALAGILATALALRVKHLGHVPGLNGDEAWSGVQAMRLVHGEPFAWRTPTGNPTNPFFLLPLAALHLVFAPSVTVLRSVACASGIVALGANFLLCRRAFGTRTAWISTVLLAVLPLNIAYSRFAWDASQSLLATVLVLYFGLELASSREPGRGRLPAMFALGAAVLVHPTNLFAVWLLFVPGAWSCRHELRAQIEAVRRGRFAGPLLCVAIAATLAATWALRSLLLTALGRAADPSQWGLCLRLLVRLFSGSTVYAFIPGPPESSTALAGADVPFVCLLLAAGVGLLYVLRAKAAVRDRVLAAGGLSMLISFFLFAGPGAMAPNFERYAVCLIAPGALLLARGWEYWLRPERPFQRLAVTVLGLSACVALAQFHACYFGVIEATGGLSHRTFRTAAAEPKQQAWQQIERIAAGAPVVIVADSWWTYWSLAYFSSASRKVRVLDWDEAQDRPWQLPAGNRLAFVAYCETPERAGLAEHMSRLAGEAHKFVITDNAGRPLLNGRVSPAD